jgi:hypothetical protein
MPETNFEWKDVRRIADEIELRIHLASMEARNRWERLRPRLAELQKTIERAGEETGKTLSEQLAVLGDSLRELRDEILGEKPGARPT